MPDDNKDKDKDTGPDRIKLAQVFEQFKETNETLTAEVKTLGEASGETKEQMDRIQDALDGLETKINQALMVGPDGKTETEKQQKDREYKDTFLKHARVGKDRMSPEEMKLLTRSDDTTGGFLAPKEYVMEIIKGVTEVSPVRQVARIRTTSNLSVQIPTRTGQFAAQWVAEMATRAETDGLRWGLEEIATHEMYGLVDITQQNLEDSAFDLEAELNEEFVLQFAVTEGTGFVSGNAAGQPEGFLNNANIEQINSGTSGAVTADGLIDLYFALKTAYAVNSTWMMNRLIIRDVRKLKDMQDQYLWQPGLAGLAPATILDRPYIEATDMPTASAGSLSIALADWRRGYTIVDRVSISLLRDPFTQATSGAVRFIARRRVGGMTVLPEAMKLQVLT